MIRYGLIGFPLTHSGSIEWFTEKLSGEGKSVYRYVNFPLSSLEEFPQVIRNNPYLIGLNVTMPYKVSIIHWLEELDELAQAVGAVNTILIQREKGNVHLKGYNTDVEGFLNSSDFSLHRSALILGTGGAAKAVAYALSRLGIQHHFVSRNPRTAFDLSYSELTDKTIKENTLIINATPLGMNPAAGIPEIPYYCLTKAHFLYDLVYNPPMTPFLVQGERFGSRVQNGKAMLIRQAEQSYRIWSTPPQPGFTR